MASYTNFACRSGGSSRNRLRLPASSPIKAESLSVVTSGAEASRDVAYLSCSAFDALCVTVLTPRFQRMKQSVIGGIRQLKILDAVVGLVLVLVVNVFFARQFSAKVSLHDEAVFKDVLSFVSNSDVATSVRYTSTLPCGVVLAGQNASVFDVLGGTRSRAASLISQCAFFCEVKTSFTNHALDGDMLSAALFEFFQSQAAAAFANPVAEISAVNESLLSALAPANPMGPRWRWGQKSDDSEATEFLSSQINESRHSVPSVRWIVPQLVVRNRRA